MLELLTYGPVAVYSRHMRSGFHAAHLAAERDLELLTVRSILSTPNSGSSFYTAFGCRAPSALRASLLAHSSLGTSSSVGTPSREGAASNFHRPGTVCKRRSGCNGRSSTHAATRRPFGPYQYTFFNTPAAAKLSDDIIGVEEASGRITPAGSRPRSQSPHIWGQFRLGPQITTSPIEPKNRCCSTGPYIVPAAPSSVHIRSVRLIDNLAHGGGEH